jgi:hypothetical protein
MGERRSACKVLTGKPEGDQLKEAGGREDNIKMDLREVVWGHELN